MYYLTKQFLIMELQSKFIKGEPMRGSQDWLKSVLKDATFTIETNSKSRAVLYMHWEDNGYGRLDEIVVLSFYGDLELNHSLFYEAKNGFFIPEVTYRGDSRTISRPVFLDTVFSPDASDLLKDFFLSAVRICEIYS